MASKLQYTRAELLAVKPLMASSASKLAEDCPVRRSLVVGTNSVSVVRHAKKGAQNGAKVSAKDREELAELKKHWHQRVAVASTTNLDTSVSSEGAKGQTSSATTKTVEIDEKKPVAKKSAWGAVASAPPVTKKEKVEKKDDKPAKKEEKKPRKSWNVTGSDVQQPTPDIPTAPLSKAALRRALDSRRTVREPEPLIGDPAAQLPSTVSSLHWNLTSFSPEYYIVPVPVLVDEQGAMLSAVDVQLRNQTNGTAARAAPGSDMMEGSSRPKTRPKDLSPDEMARRVQQRERQIRLGQRTLGYAVWEQYKRRGMKCPVDASTPPAVQACSKRSWDGQVRRWRQLLHEYDGLATNVFSQEEIDTLTASFAQNEKQGDDDE